MRPKPVEIGEGATSPRAENKTPRGGAAGPWRGGFMQS